MERRKRADCTIIIGERNKAPEISLTARFCSILISLFAMFAGIFFLLIGVTKFSMQWNAIIEAMNAQAPTASGENENNGPAETFDEGSRNTDDVDLGPFIVLCTISSIVSEMAIVFILCRTIVSFHHRVIRKSFNMTPIDNMLLNSSCVFLMGFIVFLSALAFTQFHLSVMKYGGATGQRDVNSTIVSPTESTLDWADQGIDIDADLGTSEILASDESEEDYYGESEEGNCQEYEEDAEIVNTATPVNF